MAMEKDPMYMSHSNLYSWWFPIVMFDYWRATRLIQEAAAETSGTTRLPVFHHSPVFWPVKMADCRGMPWRFLNTTRKPMETPEHRLGRWFSFLWSCQSLFTLW
jgi:hypothetical protein